MLGSHTICFAGVHFRLNSTVVGIAGERENFEICTDVEESLPSRLSLRAFAGTAVLLLAATVSIFPLAMVLLTTAGIGLAYGLLRPGKMQRITFRQTVRAKFIVNAAGLAADKISALAGDDSFSILPRVGDYFLLHKNQGKLVRHVLFPAPTKMGKGIVVQPTLWGNLLLGKPHNEETKGG